MLSAANNSTIFAINHNGTRWFWILYNLVILLSSLFGDTIILLSAIKYNAIKLHRVVLVIMQHLAVCDLFLSVFRVFPTIVLMITDRWVLGEALCCLQEHYASVCTAATVSLTGCLSISKSLTIRFPFRSRTWSGRTTHKICAVIRTLCFFTPTELMLFYILLTDSNPVHFVYISYTCDYKYPLAPT